MAPGRPGVDLDALKAWLRSLPLLPDQPKPAPSPAAPLLVESGGILQGRFLLTPTPDTRPTLEQRLVAVALVDQVGAALAESHPVPE